MKEDRKTPLERQNQRVYFNIQAIDSMQAIKNGMIGLSPETREAWKIFKSLLWKDVGFQKSQLDLYRQETKSDREAVRLLNDTTRKIFKRANRAPSIFDCTRCRDSGVTDSVVVEGHTLKVFCKCSRGVELAKNTIQINPLIRKQDILEEKIRAAKQENEREREAITARISALSWQLSDDGRWRICRFCGSAYNAYQFRNQPLGHAVRCSEMSNEVKELVAKHRALKDEYTKIRANIIKAA